MSRVSEKYYSIKELAEILSVSEATVRNWIKLGKLKPDYHKNIPYFSESYVKLTIKSLQSTSGNTLKSRRNKKYISGFGLYKDYISKASPNIKPVKHILSLINNSKLTNLIIGECGVQLLIQSKNIKTRITNNYLSEYLNEKLDLGIYGSLIDDIVKDKKSAIQNINDNPKLFETIKYSYIKNEDILGLLYLSLKNIGDRKSKGAYYTPNDVVKSLISGLNIQNGYKILDPCCGSGNFLLHLPEIINIENIYGNDIDSESISITRLNMAIKYNLTDISILYKNFTNKDYLKNYEYDGFDCIIGNPPWGSVFSKSDYEYLKTKYLTAKKQNVEAYDVFLEKSFSVINMNGRISFVLPEAILNVKTHRKIREIITSKNSIKSIQYLGNTFDKVQCPSIILEILYNNSPISCIGTEVKTKTKNFIIKKERKITPDNFNFLTDDSEYELLQKVLEPRGKFYLKDNAVFALGIVTGNNKSMIKSEKTDNNEVILKGSDISKYKINRGNNYIEYQPEKFQQCAPAEYYRAKEKLFYRFISDKLIFAYDNNQTLSLNSCNILIPKFDTISIKYVMAVLNSSIAQFIFEKQFHSLKVLRSHIESIPIPVADTKTQKEVISLVDKIIATSDKTEETQLHKTINEKISELYGVKIEKIF